MTRLLIDTDPGIDDSMAIQVALKSPEIQVEAMTTVFGNHYVDVTTRNALINLEQAGRTDIPVAQGASQPLVREFVPGTAEVHGKGGLGDCEWTDPQGKPVDTPAAMLIVDRVMRSPCAITLLAVAPLTNLALALRLEPRIASNVREVVVMGGVIQPTRDDPIAETNFRFDPEAARLVFHAGWPLTMLGLDVTMKAAMTTAHLERIQTANTRVTNFITKIAPAYVNWCRKWYGKDGIYVHDFAAVAYILDRTLFETEDLYVDIEVHGELTSGQTVADFRGKSGKRPNVKVCRAVNSERLLRMFLERITRN